MNLNSQLSATNIQSNISIKDKVKFPEIRNLFGNIKIVTTFSHANLNLPINEIYGNFFLNRLKRKAGLKSSEIMNILYDNAIPENDSPKGHRIQYGVINPKVLKPEVPYSFQAQAKYNADLIFKNSQNMLHSIPDENQLYFKKRIDSINQVYETVLKKKTLNPLEKIKLIRSNFFRLLEMDIEKEVPFSGRPTALLAEILQRLTGYGYPFWEMPLPEEYSKYKKGTSFIEGINNDKERVPVYINKNHFEFNLTGQERKRVHQDDIFKAIKNREVIPTVPVIILSFMIAPQVVHLGGGAWSEYAGPIAESIINWLDINIDKDDYLKTTGGFKPLVVYKKDRDYYGFPLIYSTFGKAKIAENISTLEKEAVELQRKVYPD